MIKPQKLFQTDIPMITGKEYWMRNIFLSKMNLITRIKLLFKPKIISVDYSDGADMTVMTTFKKLNGKLYFIDSKVL